MSDVDMEFVEDPTPVRRVCPDCTGEAAIVEDTIQPPDKPNEAWMMTTCRGTEDWKRWRWCFTLGQLSLPSQGIRAYFDRRRVNR